MSDLLEWAISAASGEERWREAAPRGWNDEANRFFDRLRCLDDYLSSELPLACSAERIFQGPIADALTHVGQLATLRRMSGAPVKGENYFVADIVIGRVGAEQSSVRKEFD